MGEENDKKKYNHLKGLIAGNHKSGNSVRDELIVSDAKRHMKDLVSKRPNIVFEEKEKPKPEEPKPKEKK